MQQNTRENCNNTGREPATSESWWTESSFARPYVFALLLFAGLMLELIIHIYLHISVVYTQFFYLIVVITGLWYGKKAIWIALFFGVTQVSVSWIITGTVPYESFIRAGLLILVAAVVGSIVDQMILYRDALRNQYLELTVSKKAYETANKKLQLLSGITRHDILNQLTVLIGYLEMSRDTVTDPSQQGFLEKELAAAGNIRHQIEFTRDYDNIGVRAPEWHGVYAGIDAVCKNYKGLDLSYSIDINNLEIYADPMLEKIYANLINNSIMHGEHVTNIHFSYIRSGDGVTLIYEDNGTGIPEGNKEKIFRKGFGKNTGFGLFLSREILSITAMTIKETGIYGKGARFEISVPAESCRFTVTRDRN